MPEIGGNAATDQSEHHDADAAILATYRAVRSIKRRSIKGCVSRNAAFIGASSCQIPPATTTSLPLDSGSAIFIDCGVTEHHESTSLANILDFGSVLQALELEAFGCAV